MKKIKNSKGITLMALIITIIILIILASIGTYSGIQVVKSSQFTAFSTELKIMQTQVNSLYEKKKNGEKVRINNVEEQVDNIGRDISNSSSSVQSQANEVFTTNASGITEQTGYKYYDNSTVKSLNIDGVEGEFFVNVDKRSVISYDGFEYEGTTYYTLKQLPNNLYNVSYEVDESNKPEFDIDTSYKYKDECILSVKNIKYNGNISKWNLMYKLEEEQEFKETKDLSVKINKEGNYKIKITNGNFESEEITKTIYLPRDYNYIKNDVEDYYGHYVTNYNSPNDEGIINTNDEEKWQIFMVDDNIYLIASDYITAQYAGKKNNVGYNYNESAPTKMWFSNIKDQYNADETKTDIPNLLSKFNNKTRTTYHKWMNIETNQIQNYDNEKVVSSMIDVDIWNGYRNALYADYAIGGPTIEMFCKAQNDAYTNPKLEVDMTAESGKGYRVKKGTDDPKDTVVITKGNAKNDLVNNMYFKVLNEGKGYWIASPSSDSRYSVVYINYDGYIHRYINDNQNIGIRPLVCLKSSIWLIKNQDGETYSIYND